MGQILRIHRYPGEQLTRQQVSRLQRTLHLYQSLLNHTQILSVPVRRQVFYGYVILLDEAIMVAALCFSHHECQVAQGVCFQVVCVSAV